MPYWMGRHLVLLVLSRSYLQYERCFFMDVSLFHISEENGKMNRQSTSHSWTWIGV